MTYRLSDDRGCSRAQLPLQMVGQAVGHRQQGKRRVADAGTREHRAAGDVKVGDPVDAAVVVHHALRGILVHPRRAHVVPRRTGDFQELAAVGREDHPAKPRLAHRLRERRDRTFKALPVGLREDPLYAHAGHPQGVGLRTQSHPAVRVRQVLGHEEAADVARARRTRRAAVDPAGDTPVPPTSRPEPFYDKV
eukprot:gene5750-7787_t